MWRKKQRMRPKSSTQRIVFLFVRCMCLHCPNRFVLTADIYKTKIVLMQCIYFSILDQRRCAKNVFCQIWWGGKVSHPHQAEQFQIRIFNISRGSQCCKGAIEQDPSHTATVNQSDSGGQLAPIGPTIVGRIRHKTGFHRQVVQLKWGRCRRYAKPDRHLLDGHQRWLLDRNIVSLEPGWFVFGGWDMSSHATMCRLRIQQVMERIHLSRSQHDNRTRDAPLFGELRPMDHRSRNDGLSRKQKQN